MDAALPSILAAWCRGVTCTALPHAAALCPRVVLVEAPPRSGKSALAARVAALLRPSGGAPSCVYSAALACDGDAVVSCDDDAAVATPAAVGAGLLGVDALRCRACGVDVPLPVPQAVLPGEDEVAPVCGHHVGFATHAELFERWCEHPALLRAGDAIRAALLAAKRAAGVAPRACARAAGGALCAPLPPLLLLSVDDADLLSLSLGEEGDYDKGTGATIAPLGSPAAGLRDLIAWATCAGCWSAAHAAAARCPSRGSQRGSIGGTQGTDAEASIATPSASLVSASVLVTCTCAAAVAAEPLWLSVPPESGPRVCTTAALEVLAADVALARSVEEGGDTAALIGALQLLACSATIVHGSDSSHPPPHTRPAAVDAWLRIHSADEEGSGEQDVSAAIDAPLVGAGACDRSGCVLWPGVQGYGPVKAVLSRRVVAPFLAAVWQRLSPPLQPHGARGREHASVAQLELLSRLGACVGGGRGDTAGSGRAPADAAALYHLLDGFTAATGDAPPSHVLLRGPPGSGKSLLGCALAATAGAALLHVACPQLLSRYVGASEAALRRVFAAARAASPCVLLLDDIDAIAGMRTGGSGGGSDAVLDRLLATLLNELDGVGGARTDASSPALPPPLVVVVATATGDSGGAWGVDAALLRPGRLEVHVALHAPAEDDRAAILAASPAAVDLARGAADAAEGPVDGLVGAAAPLDTALLFALARATAGWSAAHVAALLPEAALLAATGGGDTDDEDSSHAQVAAPGARITLEHITEAASLAGRPFSGSALACLSPATSRGN